MQEGLHTFQGYINSNDPVDSTVYLTVNLSLDGEGETYVDRSACFDVDTIVKNFKLEIEKLDYSGIQEVKDVISKIAEDKKLNYTIK